MIEMTPDLARTVADALGVRCFERKTHDAKGNAQGNLTGRTHYVDADTLRFFSSRISSSRDAFNGTVFMIVESTAGDFQNKSRGFRFVAFDMNGTVINDRKPMESMHRTSTKAEAEMWAWADGFDVVAHYRDVLEARAKQAETSAVTMRAVAETLA